MAARVLLAFLCLVLFASPFLRVNAQDEDEDDETDFDFYYLVLMWPGAYCQQSKCCLPTTGVPANDFSIRGLWPYSTAYEEPVTNCNSSPWNATEISELQDELNLHWSNLKCPSNNGVSNWKKAWKTYGACSGMSVAEYFNTALELRENVNILSLLAKRDIEPTLLYLYSVTEMKIAIKKGIGASPQIRCSKGPEGKFQLYEVYICVDNKDGKTIIECPVEQNFTCSDFIYFTPFNANNLTTTNYNNPIDMVV
ncbi:ribonuclease 3 [Canna indica]|uniref:Ribonuclease 3 n=1 Tax=Canna indica TaxID=4628 RepID=A0AAQ3L7Y8_9LILI|nr:ribonuclease 3 [Canna indica]WOL20438.1 ribonuclease 3 [Canna indica]